MDSVFRKIFYTVTLLLFAMNAAHAQNNYQIVGSTFGISDINSAACSQVDTCFTLTPNLNNQAGAVWDLNPIDLSRKFDAVFCLTLGSNDTGADGFAFVMRGMNTIPIGQTGSGIGYVGISPSLAIEFDTYDNSATFNDIAQDHTGMYANAGFAAPLVPAVPLSPAAANIEDGSYHTTRISWDPNTDSLKMYFDGNLRLEYTGNIVNTIFGGNNLVYWGFTASTGGATNLQQICFPYRSIHLEDFVICEKDTAEVSFYTNAITSYTWKTITGDTIVSWDTSDGVPFNLNDTVLYVTTTSSYILNIEFNNNVYSDTADVVVVPLPIAPFPTELIEFCPEKSVLVLDALNPGATYSWKPGNGTNQQLTIGTVLSDQGWYHVAITEPVNQCYNEDSVYISMFCLPEVEVPNVITPNGDGINDVFALIPKTDPLWIANSSFTIMNRWGNVVYTVKNNMPVWDGTSGNQPVSPGVYFYTGSYTDIRNQETIKIQGNITVQR